MNWSKEENEGNNILCKLNPELKLSRRARQKTTKYKVKNTKKRKITFEKVKQIKHNPPLFYMPRLNLSPLKLDTCANTCSDIEYHQIAFHYYVLFFLLVFRLQT